jgi:hypothetical protein
MCGVLNNSRNTGTLDDLRNISKANETPKKSPDNQNSISPARPSTFPHAAAISQLFMFRWGFLASIRENKLRTERETIAKCILPKISLITDAYEARNYLLSDYN